LESAIPYFHHGQIHGFAMRCSNLREFPLPASRWLGLWLAFSLSLSACAPTDIPSSAPAPDPPPETENQHPTDPVLDSTLIPGERVGAITANTTYADLVNLYGAEVLEPVEVHLGEGMFQPGTRINLGDRTLSVVWADDTQTAVASARDFGPAWQVEPGLGLGTSLAEMQAALGDFEVYGFGWDYGGTVVLEGTVLEPYQDSLFLRFSPRDGWESPPEAYFTVMGEARFPADAPALQTLDLVVTEMVVLLN
jgi:hypothetical protein